MNTAKRSQVAKTNPLSRYLDVMSTIIVGIPAALLVATMLTDGAPPFNMSERAAFFTLAGLGLLMCTLAFPLRSPLQGWRWTNPLTVASMILGAVALGLVILVLFGNWLPSAVSESQAFFALAAVILAKVTLGHVRMWLV